MASVTISKATVSESILRSGVVSSTSNRLSTFNGRRAMKSSRFSVSAKLSESFDSEAMQANAAKTLAGSVFMVMANANSALAAEEIAQLAEGDNRAIVLLLVLVPALGWVLFNILKPALNQVNKMRAAKSLVGALGLGAAGSMILADNADAAQEITQLAADNRPLILLFILLPALGWVLFNILKPALNQINKMSGTKAVIGAAGLSAASLLAASDADAAQEVAQLAADNRPLILLLVLVPAVGWVLFNILQPALRQIQNQVEKNSRK